MTGLTQRQHDALEYVETYSAENGVSPSFVEIRDALGYASNSNVHRLVRALEQRGAIRRLPGQARSLQVVRKRPPTAAELNRFGTPDLLTLLAHVCGILGFRLGPAKLRETLDRIGARMAERAS